MQKISAHIFCKMSFLKIICVIIDVLAFLYISTYFYWIFGNLAIYENELLSFFTIINPMTYGTYISGIALILHCYVFENILSRIVLWFLYLSSVAVSPVSIMGMVEWREFVIFVPHPIIIIAAIIVMHKKKKINVSDVDAKI